jgi:UDP-N-acetylglucosamine 2-epimerase (non-hydrolysing)
MAPVMKRLKEESIDYNYISTGQHKETINKILENFEIKGPDVTLYNGKDITSVFQMFFWAAGIISRSAFNRRKIFLHDKQGVVLVHGDTFSTLIGAILGKTSGLKVAHIESGLRSFNLLHPFPEEITRLMTFRLSDYMFYPGEWAIENLKSYKGEKINTQANTLYDSLRYALPKIKAINDVDIPAENYGLVTLHRFENIYSKSALERVVSIVESISEKKKLLFIMHKPTRKRLEKFGLMPRLVQNRNIEIRPRYDYFRFIRLVIDAEFLVSDGGSTQEECDYLGKPVILLRNATERKEGVGKNCVLSQYKDSIIDEFIDNVSAYSFDFKEMDITPSEIIIRHCLKIA